jgi:hypothetical protein
MEKSPNLSYRLARMNLSYRLDYMLEGILFLSIGRMNLFTFTQWNGPSQRQLEQFTSQRQLDKCQRQLEEFTLTTQKEKVRKEWDKFTLNVLEGGKNYLSRNSLLMNC